VLLEASLFNSRVNFPQWYWLSKRWFQTNHNFNHPPKKGVIGKKPLNITSRKRRNLEGSHHVGNFVINHFTTLPCLHHTSYNFYLRGFLIFYVICYIVKSYFSSNLHHPPLMIISWRTRVSFREQIVPCVGHDDPKIILDLVFS
jgi:hypothetical protein